MDDKYEIGDGESADALDRIIAVMATHGDLPAGVIAELAGLAYSTTTPKLRALEEQGRAERYRVDGGRTLWRLPAAGQPDAHALATTSDTEPPGPTANPTTESEKDTTYEQQAPDGPADDRIPDLDPPAEIPATGTDVAAEASTAPADPPGATDTVPTAAAAAAATTEAVAPRATTGQPSPDDTDQVAHTAGGAHSPADPALPAAAVNQAGDKRRRGKGVLRDAVLAILQTHPDDPYKVGELSKFLDGASAGAVANALTKLAADGAITQTVDKPATFQAA